MLTDKGYIRPTFDELLNKRIFLAKNLFGNDIDTSEKSVLGKFIRLGVYDLAQAYEDIENIYLARFPHSSSGQSLDRLLPFAGIKRNPKTAAIHKVEFSGNAGYEIPIGFLVASSPSGAIFHTLETVSVDDTGKCVAEVECNEFGEVGNVLDISEIVNPDADVSGVRYLSLVVRGSNTESDYELRKRFDKTVAGAGSATENAITAEILRVQGVRGCLLVVNNENEPDADGRPPHSFECFVLASENTDYDVAEAIFNKKPLGIKSIGDVEIDVLDDGGHSHTVRFSRTVEVIVHIKVSIKVDALFESDGVQQIKDNLSSHIAGLKNGEDVVLSTLYGDIHSVTGVRETSFLKLSTDGNTWVDNIKIEANEVAKLGGITIEVSDYDR